MASKPGEFCMRCGRKCRVQQRTIDGKQYAVYTCPGTEVRRNAFVGSHGEQRRELVETQEPETK